jgi:catechol 2,3-dioxygenase-like lactoylglutathione lyase family enzyme
VAQILSKPRFPDDKMALTNILAVSDLTSSVTWYRDILGARFHSEHGGTSAVFEFNGSWILLVTGGGPTADKPDARFAAPVANSPVDHSLTIRVGDCQQAYKILFERGAKFLTPPYEWEHETRCFFRDPDGLLFEISQV